MANYQVLFNGEVADAANAEHVRTNLARELGLDERKARQLFSGRTVVIRSQLEQREAQAWQDKLAGLGAICRIKDLSAKVEKAEYRVDKNLADKTLRDITAAHLECPRCGHMQLDSSHCARCGTDLVQAFKQKRKEDLLIEKKLRDHRMRSHPKSAPRVEAPVEAPRVEDDEAPRKKGVLSWLKRG